MRIRPTREVDVVRRWPSLQRSGIRARVTAAASAVLFVALAVGSVLLVLLVHQSLQTNLDTAAATRARDVAAIIAAGQVTPTVVANGQDNSLVQVIDSTGALVSASENIQGEPPVLTHPPVTRAPSVVTERSLPVGGGSQTFRIVAEPVQLPSGPGWVYVASSLGQVDAAVRSMVLLLGVGLPMMLFIVGWTVWAAVGRALRPVEEIRKRAVAIGADLAQRVPVPASHDEVSRLAETMNGMLTRLEASVVRQQRFVGDASHELRSPLAALRAQVDVALTHADQADAVGVLRGVQTQAANMTVLLDDLLFLARFSENGSDRHAHAVDLDELVIAEVHRLQSAESHPVRLTGLDAARITGSARDLGRMLGNLGDNALRHARTSVTVELRCTSDTAIVTVTDDGTGVLPEDRERIFERFTRLDDARSRAPGSGGAGLGLAIAQQIAVAHGGAITVDSRADGLDGAVFSVRLPIRPAPPQSGRSQVRAPIITRDSEGGVRA
ncbi:MAG: sensor histidine kinase [Lacisediminihabitans sp.]